VGEKEIKPGTTPGGAVTPGAAPTAAPVTQAGGPHTTERAGTGGPQTTTPPPPPPPPPGRTSSWSGSDLYPDGFTMARDASGETTLTDPHGMRATWDQGSTQWLGPDGQPMPPDWSGGHQPTQYSIGTSSNP